MHDLAALEFERRANEKLPPEFRVEAAGDSRFGYDTVTLEKLKTGEIALSLPGSVMSTVSPKFGVFELPFLVRNRDQIRKINEALLEPILQPEAKKKGYKVIAIWENGFRQFTNSTRPIKYPKDLVGIKIRTPKSAWWEKVLRTLGAEPVPLSYAEVYGSLKSKAIDAQEAPLAQINAAKLYEVQRYLSLSDHIYTPIYLVASDEQFAKLPADVQKILVETGQDLREWVYSTAIKLENEIIDDLSEKMEVNYVDLKSFRRASRPLYAEFARTVPGGLKLIEILSALAEVPESEVGVSGMSLTPPAVSAISAQPAPASPAVINDEAGVAPR